MRALRFGLLLLVAAAAGCVYSDDYNGLPWEWLAKRANENNPADSLIRHPEYSQAKRFNKPGDEASSGSTEARAGAAGDSNGEIGTTTPVDQSPPEESSAE